MTTPNFIASAAETYLWMYEGERPEPGVIPLGPDQLPPAAQKVYLTIVRHLQNSVTYLDEIREIKHRYH